MIPLVVLDSNVFVSTLLGDGPCRALVKEWRKGSFEVAISSVLLDELREVLGRPKFHNRCSQADIQELLVFVQSTAIHIEPRRLAHPISRDKTDDEVFACALSAAASYVVSGDADVLEVSTAKLSGRLRVLSPRAFLTELTSS